jgi:tektin-4
VELVRDAPEEELIKEISLISEIKRQLNQTLNDMQAQQIANRAARERLEYDWSDKKEAYENEAINCNLTNTSSTTLFKPGAVRLNAEYGYNLICKSKLKLIHVSLQTIDGRGLGTFYENHSR